jgi:hypothetical protein
MVHAIAGPVRSTRQTAALDTGGASVKLKGVARKCKSVSDTTSESAASRAIVIRNDRSSLPTFVAVTCFVFRFS